MKSSKKFFAAVLAVMHVLTFSAPAQQINIQEGTTLTVDSIQVNEGEQLSINVVDQLGQVCPSCRGILETNNFLNNGAIDIWGILAIIAPTIINNGTITVQGDLLLSNLGINQAQFFAGIAELSKDPSLANGYILNTGEIKNLTQGLLAMIAANGGVHNLGTITSNGGAVVVAAGDRASFPLTRDGVLNIDLGSVTGVKGQVFDKDGNLVETNGLVTNAGIIQANGGAVVLQAAGAEAVYDSIINHTGIIEAKSVAQENGKIILKSETGNITVNNATIDASGYNAGEKGGSIELLTQGNVVVEGSSVLDASGDIGGGSILIGSDVNVTGPLTASNVFVGSDVEVKADAVTNGNGGKIIVGAEEVALAYGDFSAKGGAQSGNGGFIETSGKSYLDVDGIGIDASAVNGEAGKWLLDPRTVNITNAANSLGAFSGVDPKTWDSTSSLTGLPLLFFVLSNLVNASNVSANAIQGFLNAGTSVVITTNSNVSLTAGDINVQSSITKTSGAVATLSLIADGAITIGATIGATGPGGILNLILQSGGAISQTAALTITGTTTITAGAANNVTLNDAGNNFTGAVSVVSGNNVSLRDSDAIILGASTVSGTLGVTANGAITDNGALVVTGATTLAAGAANNITLDNANNFSSVGITSGNNVVLNDTNAIALNASTVSGTLGVTANGAITDNGALSVAGATTLAAGAANDITLDNSNNFSSVGVTTGRNVTLNDTNAIALNASTVSGTLGVTANGAITDNGALAVTGATTLAAGAGNDITLDNANNFSSIGITTGKNVLLNDINALALNASTVSGTLGVTTAGAITDNGAIVVNGGANLTAGALNDITLDAANDFQGPVAIISGKDVTLNNTNGMDIDNSTISGFLTVTAGGLIDFVGNAATTIAGAMNLTTTASGINDSGTGSVAVTGVTTLDATGVGNNITLDNATNDFSTVVVTNGNDVLLNDATALTLGDSTVTGTFNATAVTGDLTVNSLSATATTLAATAGSIIDGNGVATNVAGTSLNATAATGIDLDTDVTDITASNTGAGNININEANGANALSVVAANGDSTVTTTTGDLNVTIVTATNGTATLTAGAGKITDANGVTNNITANSLVASSSTGIDLDTTVTNLTASTTGAAGAIDINDLAGGLNVISAITTDGAITINATNGNLTATTVTADGLGKDVLLSTTTAGDVLVGTVTALDDKVTVNSAAKILELVNDDSNPNPPGPSADIIAGTIQLNSNGDTGAPNSYLDINPSVKWGATTNGGNLYINCIGLCPIDQVDLGTGTFYYAGNITDGNDGVNGHFDEVNGAWLALGGDPADPLDVADWNIRAGGVHLDAANTLAGFIGSSTNWIEMRLAGAGAALGKITAAAGTGGIHVSNDDIAAHPGLQIGGVTAVPAPNNLADGLVSTGGIEIYSFSPLVIAANVIDNSALSIDLVAAGNLAADDLTVNTGVTVDQQGAGTVRLFAGDDISLNGTALVQSTTGTISANAGEDFADFTVDRDGTNGGSLVMNSNSAFRSQDGNINLTANNHLRISEVNANSNADATLGDVNLSADANANGVGRIEDRNGANALNVTGNNLTMTAGSGIGVNGANTVDAIETNVVSLDLINTTSGHVAVTEVAAGGNLDIVRANQNGAGDMTILTENGRLRVIAGGTGAHATSGETLLSATGGDLVIRNNVSSTSGKINLDSTTRDVEILGAGNVTSTSGEVEANAQRHFNMADGTFVNSGTGIIDVDAQTGNATLASLQTTSTASTSRGDAADAVSVNALSGAVIDGGDTSDDIIANFGETQIGAANGIGHGNSLEVQLDRLTATNSTSNDIDLREQVAGGALNIVRVAQSAATGRIDVQTLDGTLTVLSEAVGGFVGNGVVGLAGEIFLRANGAGNNDDLVLNNQIQSSTGKINLDSTSRDVIADAEGDATAAVGAEIESDALRNITMADGTVWNANAGHAVNGGIDLDARDGNITLGSVQTTSTLNHAVVIFAKNGAIIDGGDLDVDITSGASTVGVSGSGGGILLKASTGIGSIGSANPVVVNPNNLANNFATDALDTQGGRIAAQTETGDIQISNTGHLEITTLSDNDGASSQSAPGAGTVTGILNNDAAHIDPSSIIFVTTHSPMTISSAVTNLDGGNISLYALGGLVTDTMTINANVQSLNGNGDIRLVSGGSMTTGANVNISTQGTAPVSGTGRVAIGAGFDATGKAANASIDVNPLFDALSLPGLSGASLVSTSTDPAGSLFDTASPVNTAANLTMDETSTISTESGRIIVDAQNNFTVGRVDADGNAGANGLTDGVVGNILAFARNGSITDAAAGPDFGNANLDFVANSLSLLANGAIGSSADPIEGSAPFTNTFSFGNQFMNMQGDSQVELNSANGSIFFNATGTILLGHASASGGEVHLNAGGDILSQGGGETRVTASNLIELIANGILGTTSNPIHTHLNATPAQINLSAGGQAGNGVSAAVFSNVSPLAINMLNNPPGLVLFNGTPVAGQALSGLIGSQASLYYKAFVRGLRQYGDFDGNYAADFPGFVDYQGLISSPDLSVDTTGLDIPLRGITTAPRVVPIPRPAVPTPVQPTAVEPQPAVQQQVPELSTQEPTPPAVVPIPARAQPSDQVTTDEGVPVTPTASN